MEIEQLREQAEKVIALSKKFDESFPYGHTNEHLILCIMAGLKDAYVSGLTSSITHTEP